MAEWCERHKFHDDIDRLGRKFMKCLLGSELVLNRYSFIHLTKVKNPRKTWMLITCNCEILIVKKIQFLEQKG